MEDIFEETVVNIDGGDVKDQLAVVEYVEDLYSYYKKMEVKGTKFLTISTYRTCSYYWILYNCIQESDMNQLLISMNLLAHCQY